MKLTPSPILLDMPRKRETQPRIHNLPANECFCYKIFHASSKYYENHGFPPSNLVIQMIVAILFYAKLVCKCPLIMLLTGIMFIFQIVSHKVKISQKWLNGSKN